MCDTAYFFSPKYIWGQLLQGKDLTRNFILKSESSIQNSCTAVPKETEVQSGLSEGWGRRCLTGHNWLVHMFKKKDTFERFSIGSIQTDDWIEKPTSAHTCQEKEWIWPTHPIQVLLCMKKRYSEKDKNIPEETLTFSYVTDLLAVLPVHHRPPQWPLSACWWSSAFPH